MGPLTGNNELASKDSGAFTFAELFSENSKDSLMEGHHVKGCLERLGYLLAWTSFLLEGGNR